MTETLLGTWKLISWRRLSQDASASFPLGPAASGILIYAPGGRMAVQMTGERRSPLATTDPLGGSPQERAAAYSGYLAYFGGYTFTDDTVTHLVEGSSYPNWSGAQQERPYTIEVGRLVLRTLPTSLPDGSVVVNEMSWERAGSR
ncbi:lipocalin-like domain-containing protein [Kineosporia sp. NBRC 101731]|uniref:lipocalin-like domain-containing protein n=1 Tax=Kineosporia sp. NBRC 101731 TaxID=3032199 RepID=UPI0024A503BB|nr:lipocalin-like domain-containing protein [Kineosporia sp. NBRC 101731]GLY29231.1 hypothetical protein Kisp02_25960 [Kineosporia sp. NBRC 101731]